MSFYKREAENLISDRIKIWSEQMNLRPNTVRFRNQKSRWGSCSSRGSISINWRLIGAPLEVIDYILVHESGHEWFGNNISTQDIADMWVHEGFTTYSEVLFVQSRYGKKAGNEYARGLRTNILNDKPIIAPYGINREGSGDMYFKGVQIIHTYRQMLNDDERFRELLHEMNRRFGRRTITSQDVEDLMLSK